MHGRLSSTQRAGLGGGAALTGIRISGGRNEKERLLFFDNLAVYHEELPPLEFAPRGRREA